MTDTSTSRPEARSEAGSPASADIPLVEVTDVASQQPDDGAMPFNGFRKK